MRVNPRINAPRPPGEWVDLETCYVCGEDYEEFRCFPSFAEAADRLRHAAKAAGDDGGGFRSRGPVLWIMRTEKLSQWFHKHLGCGSEFQNGGGGHLNEQDKIEQRTQGAVAAVVS